MGEVQNMYSREDMLAVLILCGCVQAQNEQELTEQYQETQEVKEK